MTTRKYYVYEIWEDGAETPFYVGKTHDVEQRKQAHLKNKNTTRMLPVHFKLQKLLRENVSFDFRTVAECDTEEASFQLEQELISKYGRLDLGTGPLFNMTAGGEGVSGWIPDAEVRAKWSEQRKGKVPSNKGTSYKHTNQSKRKGKPWSEKQRQQHDQLTEEQKKTRSANMVNAQKGKVPSKSQNTAHSIKMTGDGNPNYGKTGVWAGKVGPRKGMTSPVKGKKKGPDGKMYFPHELEEKFPPVKVLAPNSKYKVLTPSGWQDFAGVSVMGVGPTIEFVFSDDSTVEVSHHHKFYTLDNQPIAAEDLLVGHSILSKSGSTAVVQKLYHDAVQSTYSLIEVAGGHQYYTNNVVSKNCEFVSDDETLIDAMTLTTLRYREPEFYTGQVRWFREPEANKTFLIGLDPSLGTGGDFAAIQVFQVPEMVQVAEWQHNKTAPRGQIKIMMQTLLMLNQSLMENPEQQGEPEIFWTVENNSIGEAVLQIIEDTGEHNFPGIFVSEKRVAGQGRGRFRKGLNTSNAKKLSACSKLKSLMESGRMTVNSQSLIRQFKNFVSHGASYAAKSGEHDDLVSATLLVVRILDAIIGWLNEDYSEGLKEIVSPEDDDSMPLAIM
jgi:hypothetical protein